MISLFRVIFCRCHLNFGFKYWWNNPLKVLLNEEAISAGFIFHYISYRALYSISVKEKEGYRTFQKIVISGHILWGFQFLTLLGAQLILTSSQFPILYFIVMPTYVLFRVIAFLLFVLMLRFILDYPFFKPYFWRLDLPLIWCLSCWLFYLLHT